MNRFSRCRGNTQFTRNTHISISSLSSSVFSSEFNRREGWVFFYSWPDLVCSIIKPWILISEGSRESQFCALSPPLWEKCPWLCKQATCERCPLFSHLPLSSPLSRRCVQWEWPNALLEERERFIKDWWDCALSVFYWRLPAFLWACLLQQYGYVRSEVGGSLCCTLLGNDRRAPYFIHIIKEILFKPFKWTEAHQTTYASLSTYVVSN